MGGSGGDGGTFEKNGDRSEDEEAFRRAARRLKAGTRPSPGPEDAAPHHPRGTDRNSTSSAGPDIGGDRSDAGPPGPGGSEPEPPPQRGRGSEFSAVTSRISDRSGSLAHRDACWELIEGRPSTRVPVR